MAATQDDKVSETSEYDLALEAFEEMDQLAKYRTICPSRCASVKKKCLLKKIESEMLFKVEENTPYTSPYNTRADLERLGLLTEIVVSDETSSKLQEQLSALQSALELIKRT